jgi:hypothetical protein
MKKLLSRLQKAADWLDHEDPSEPSYDPVHLGAVLIVNLVVVGALYWMLWTLLVYEGGIFVKASALSQLAFGGKSLADLGYQGSYNQGLFEGWLGNLGALTFCALTLTALYNIYSRAARRAKR